MICSDGISVVLLGTGYSIDRIRLSREMGDDSDRSPRPISLKALPIASNKEENQPKDH
jgi:hypothetical protein